MLAGSSVLSIVAPPIGVPLLATSAGFAASQFAGTDPVSASGSAVATGQNQTVMQNAINNSAITGTALAQLTAYNQYIQQGYSPIQAQAMSGYNTNESGLPTWAIYGGLAVVALVVLKLLKIIK